MTGATRDLIVVLPGIMGSTLVDADGREVWGLGAGTIARHALTRGRDIRRLTLPDGIGDAHPGDGIRPGRLLPDLHVIPGIWTISVGYDRLLQHLRRHHGEEDVVVFPYDWRLSNRYNGKLLWETVRPLLERRRARAGQEDAKLVLVGHSMGGLVARWFLDREGGAEVTRKLVTLGTPHRGAASAVDRLVNGLRLGLGPLAVDLTALARSLPSLFQLLPEYACVDRNGELAKTTELDLPNLPTALVADAMSFHDQLDGGDPAAAAGYDLYPVVGTDQPTATSVRLDGSTARLLPTIGPDDEKGDATVPRFAARPKGLRGTSPALHHVADSHTALPGNQAVLDEISGILTASAVERRGAPAVYGVRVPELLLAGAPLPVEVEVSGEPGVVEARLLDGDTVVTARRLSREADGLYRTELVPPAPALYSVVVGRRHPSGHLHHRVTTATAVLDPEAVTTD
jgi:pimeloyl-ACP methyl ester carboxylesterase